ncbi:MAG TPA: cupin domain-containing protein [Edaphobacter sp.]
MSLTPVKQFLVFGEPVEVLVSSEQTHGSFCVVTQVSPPGGGPPPHIHEREDELFTVLEGDYEVFDGKEWHPLRKGESAFKLRGSLHTFRNCGTTDGKIHVVITPGSFDLYLEELSKLSMPPTIEEVVAVSTPYGISFPPLP